MCYAIPEQTTATPSEDTPLLKTPPDFATPFAYSSGPKNAKIAIVGEAWGEQEELSRRPFQGSSGKELNNMLKAVGLNRIDCFVTNTLVGRPPQNNLDSVLLKRKDMPKGMPMRLFRKGVYWNPDLNPHLDRLEQELLAVRPNLVLALGATATWALLGTSAISSVRGVCALSASGLKVLPTYHPAAILRQWSLRTIAMMDMQKAAREAQSPELIVRQRKILINPTLEQVLAFSEGSYERLGVDIETAGGQITMIGFAPDPLHAIVIPFAKNPHYWATPYEETVAWKAVRNLLRSPAKKVFQNGLYDIQWLWRQGFRVTNASDDTMLLHHSLYSELPKSLGFLGSLYTNEVSWKLARAKHNQPEKKDE